MKISNTKCEALGEYGKPIPLKFFEVKQKLHDFYVFQVHKSFQKL